MNGAQTIARSVPSVYRRKILLEWLPNAAPTMENESMQHLFSAWFIYAEPDGVQKKDCPKCVRNVLENWKALSDYLVEEEKQYNLLNALEL